MDCSPMEKRLDANCFPIRELSRYLSIELRTNIYVSLLTDANIPANWG